MCLVSVPKTWPTSGALSRPAVERRTIATIGYSMGSCEFLPRMFASSQALRVDPLTPMSLIELCLAARFTGGLPMRKWRRDDAGPASWRAGCHASSRTPFAERSTTYPRSPRRVPEGPLVPQPNERWVRGRGNRRRSRDRGRGRSRLIRGLRRARRRCRT